jgi:hypothetical protein
MPTPAKKYKYAVMRTDNTAVTYEWTTVEYKKICDSLVSDMKFASFQDGIINLEGIRAIVKQEPPKEPKDVKPLESGTPEMDVVGLQWLKEQQKQMQQWYESQQYDEDSELDGGRFS